MTCFESLKPIPSLASGEKFYVSKAFSRSQRAVTSYKMRHADALFVLLQIIFLGACQVLTENDGEPVCGYDSCPKSNPNVLNIHLVPHSHDDVGWVKTIDEYYNRQVQHIISNVVTSLTKDPSRRFIQVEIAYFWRWWQQQTESKKKIVKSLINEGRLEFVNGGWTANDEATTYYQSIIDQFTWGFRRLNDTFGNCARPKIGWHIDSFGHSREQASIFARLGFDGSFFARLDHEDRIQRYIDMTNEFLWHGSPSLGKSADLFTSILHRHYSAPPGFCFDITCSDQVPIIDDYNSSHYNVDKRARKFIDYAKMQASAYKTNNILFTMGDDFTYQYAETWYLNMDKLIKYINNEYSTMYKVFYSTPSCYLKSLNKSNMTWSTKSDDFFPYASDSASFWTGYYTSRPTFKYYERLGNNFLQITKQLSVLANQSDNEKLQLFREAMGVMQHHDAITGTEKHYVAADYIRSLYHSIKDAESIVSKALNKLVSKKQPSDIRFHSCQQLNISVCEYSSENEKFVVTVYNPTSQPTSIYVRLPVQFNWSYDVKDYTGKSIVTQVVPIPESVRKIPGRISSATGELIFQAVNISALGYQSFYVSKIEKQNETSSDIVDEKFYNITVNSKGKVVVHSLKSAEGLLFEQYFYYYESTGYGRLEGAYIFRPRRIPEDELRYLRTSHQIFKGPLVEEIHQVINDWISQVIRIYRGKNYVEFNWLVGPIPIDDFNGKNIVSRYASNIKNYGEFYTDSNGREMLKRKLDYRPSWNVTYIEPIAGNYYPVTTKLSIECEKNKWRLSALNDRSQGGSSLKNGEIELMVHRRLLRDDYLGLNEALNEVAYGQGLVARGQHYLIGSSLENIDSAILWEKELAMKLNLKPWTFITPTTLSFDEWNETYRMKSNSLLKTLPKNVRILTLEPWKDGEILLRLEHIFEKNETTAYSSPVQVDLKDLFSDFSIKSIRETTLGANQWIDDMQRFQWRTEEIENPEDQVTSSRAFVDNIVHLNPMEIKTFVIVLSYRPKFTS